RRRHTRADRDWSSDVCSSDLYAIFQTAHNAAVMAAARSEERGAVSGWLNLSRNLGLMAGVSVMGGLYQATGMRVTFAVAVALSRSEERREGKVGDEIGGRDGD